MRAYGLAKVAVFYLAMLAVAVGVMRFEGGLALLLPRMPARSWAFCSGLGLGVGLIIVWFTRLSVRRYGWARSLVEALRVAIGELRWSEALAIALFSSVGEEALFRGALQPVVGLFGASLIFGLLHTGPSRLFRPWTVMAFVVGLLLGWMLQVTGNLVAPIVTHMTVNFLNLRYIAEERTGAEIHVGASSGERLLRQ